MQYPLYPVYQQMLSSALLHRSCFTLGVVAPWNRSNGEVVTIAFSYFIFSVFDSLHLTSFQHFSLRKLLNFCHFNFDMLQLFTWLFPFGLLSTLTFCHLTFIIFDFLHLTFCLLTLCNFDFLHFWLFAFDFLEFWLSAVLTFCDLTSCPLTFSSFDFFPFDFYPFWFFAFNFLSFDFLSFNFL